MYPKWLIVVGACILGAATTTAAAVTTSGNSSSVAEVDSSTRTSFTVCPGGYGTPTSVTINGPGCSLGLCNFQENIIYSFRHTFTTTNVPTLYKLTMTYVPLSSARPLIPIGPMLPSVTTVGPINTISVSSLFVFSTNTPSFIPYPYLITATILDSLGNLATCVQFS